MPETPSSSVISTSQPDYGSVTPTVPMGLDTMVLVTAIVTVVCAVVVVVIGVLVAALCACNRYRDRQMRPPVKEKELPTNSENSCTVVENLPYDYEVPRSLVTVTPRPGPALTHNPAYGCREAGITDSDESKG